MSESNKERLAREYRELEQTARQGFMANTDEYLVGYVSTRNDPNSVGHQNGAIIEMQRRLVAVIREGKAAAEKQAAETHLLNQRMFALTVATGILAFVQAWAGVMELLK